MTIITATLQSMEGLMQVLISLLVIAFALSVGWAAWERRSMTLHCAACAKGVKLKRRRRTVYLDGMEGWTFSSGRGWRCAECSPSPRPISMATAPNIIGGEDAA